MPSWDILVDGERQARVKSEAAVREWLARYLAEQAEKDPHAAHVQVVERGRLGRLGGGRLVSRDRFGP